MLEQESVSRILLGRKGSALVHLVVGEKKLMDWGMSSINRKRDVCLVDIFHPIHSCLICLVPDLSTPGSKYTSYNSVLGSVSLCPLLQGKYFIPFEMSQVGSRAWVSNPMSCSIILLVGLQSDLAHPWSNPPSFIITLCFLFHPLLQRFICPACWWRTSYCFVEAT